MMIVISDHCPMKIEYLVYSEEVKTRDNFNTFNNPKQQIFINNKPIVACEMDASREACNNLY